ncbi:hypothetical protein IQ259_01095 [Fortiea sp. LEGE XX443]|uniref:hypothetical protein n=1 Tax=Fortiea sp. LEGE XX443 TaxID=1828611 RepID=UPI0019DF7ACD|nr:hypothetical protein [Fortiea sp. LEGE XX443]
MVQAPQFIDGDKKHYSFFQAPDFSRGVTTTNYVSVAVASPRNPAEKQAFG